MARVDKNVHEFVQKLFALMTEHGITSIGGAYDGDTHGTHSDRFEVEVSGGNVPVVISKSSGTLVYRGDIIDWLRDHKPSTRR